MGDDAAHEWGTRHVIVTAARFLTRDLTWMQVLILANFSFTSTQ
jgi:hypothetical protein